MSEQPDLKTIMKDGAKNIHDQEAMLRAFASHGINRLSMFEVQSCRCGTIYRLSFFPNSSDGLDGMDEITVEYRERNSLGGPGGKENG